MAVLADNVEMVHVDAVKLHPQNPNEGDLGAIVSSIEANGFYGSLVVQRSTGYILAGNHRAQAAKLCGIDRVPVMYVDVDDRQAIKILLADNRTSELATREPNALAALLMELSHDEDLDGTGYAYEDLQEVLDSLEPVDFEADPVSSDLPKTCPRCGYDL